jgi:heme-degrading monooxygenase HmoA
MFLVVFRNRQRAGIDSAAYATDGERMRSLAYAQPGFVSFKSYVADDGEAIDLSEWESDEAARDWGEHPDHSATQAKGRAEYYQDYTLFTCNNPRTHAFDRSKS